MTTATDETPSLVDEIVQGPESLQVAGKRDRPSDDEETPVAAETSGATSEPPAAAKAPAEPASDGESESSLKRPRGRSSNDLVAIGRRGDLDALKLLFSEDADMASMKQWIPEYLRPVSESQQKYAIVHLTCTAAGSEYQQKCVIRRLLCQCIEEAAAHGQFCIIKWLHANIPVSKRFIKTSSDKLLCAALSNGHSECAGHILEEFGVPGPRSRYAASVMAAAIKGGGYLDVVMAEREFRAHFAHADIETAASNGRKDLLKLIVSHSGPDPFRVAMGAIQGGHLDILNTLDDYDEGEGDVISELEMEQLMVAAATRATQATKFFDWAARRCGSLYPTEFDDIMNRVIAKVAKNDMHGDKARVYVGSDSTSYERFEFFTWVLDEFHLTWKRHYEAMTAIANFGLVSGLEFLMDMVHACDSPDGPVDVNIVYSNEYVLRAINWDRCATIRRIHSKGYVMDTALLNHPQSMQMFMLMTDLTGASEVVVYDACFNGKTGHMNAIRIPVWDRTMFDRWFTSRFGGKEPVDSPPHQARLDAVRGYKLSRHVAWSSGDDAR